VTQSYGLQFFTYHHNLRHFHPIDRYEATKFPEWLSCYLTGTMQLDHSNHMSLHVSTCTSYSFNAVKPVCMEVVVLSPCMFLCIVINEW